MPYQIVKNTEGKHCVVLESNPEKKFGCFNTFDEAEEQITILDITDKSIKSSDDLLNLTNTESYDIINNINEGTIKVEGYLFRYSDPQKNHERDLHNQFWSKDTYLMTETFPIKGMPIMYSHSLKDEFVKVGIGVVTYAEEDEIGLFIKGELHDRAKWAKIVDEVNRRRGLGLSRKQVEEIATKGFDNIKSVVSEVPLQWSMGSYPPTYKVEKKTGKIERAGIVEATLTPVPAEPDGTNAYFSFKSFVDFLTLKELDAKEVKEDSFEFIKNYLNQNNIKQGIKMAEKPFPLSKEDKMKKAFGNFAKEMVDIMSTEAEKQLEVEVEEEEKEQMKSVIIAEIEKRVNKDTGFKSAFESDDENAMKSVIAQIVKDNSGEILGDSVANYLNTKAQEKAEYQKSIGAAFQNYKTNSKQEAPKSNQTGGYQATQEDTRKGYIDPMSIKNYETGIGDFFRQVANRENPHQDYTKSMKAQNPYIGVLGGVLVGQEMAQTILDPLRPQVVTFGMGLTETRVNNIGIYTRPKMTTVPTAYRPGINQQITETEAKYDTITAMLRPLAARIVIPRQMLMTTGTNMEQQLRAEIIRSLRLQIDKEVLEGVGSVAGTGNTGGQILGVKRSVAASDAAATNAVELGTGNGAKPKYDDLINAETAISTNNVELDESTSGWIMHPRDRGTFRRTTGTDGHPLLYPNYSGKPYEDLIGYKVATTTQITNTQTVGTSTDCSDIYFGNWRFGEYVLGNDIEVILDDMTLADQLQVRFIVYMYSDFIVHYPEAFYVMSGVRA